VASARAVTGVRLAVLVRGPCRCGWCPGIVRAKSAPNAAAGLTEVAGAFGLHIGEAVASADRQLLAHVRGIAAREYVPSRTISADLA
jgi:hypothetical protein